MALDSGIHAGMTVLLQFAGSQAGAWERTSTHKCHTTQIKLMGGGKNISNRVTKESKNMFFDSNNL
jgi:hypothetical protein